MAALAEPLTNNIARLCEACQTAIDNVGPVNLVIPPGVGDYSEFISTGYFLVDLFPYLPKLEESRRQGCDFCNFLREIILSEETSDGLLRTFRKSSLDLGTREVDIEIFYEWVEREKPDSPGLDKLRVDLSFRGINIAVSLTCVVEAAARYPGADVIAKQLGLAAPSNQSYCDDETVRWMNTALRSCRKHENRLPTDSFIPERLLDVRGKNPRVVLRSDWVSPRYTGSNVGTETPKYAALSYCWGSMMDAQAQLKTTTVSLPKRLIAIDCSQLTAALWDAVRITKLLSLDYLWVDALCILQDSSSDWERQCADMGKIYGNAYVTLRAAASMSCHQGFLAQKGCRLIVPYQTDSWPAKRGSFLLQFKYVGPEGDYLPDHATDTLMGDSGRCTLDNRGWAFQENILSTRVLLFGHANVHFICEHMHQSRGMDYFIEGLYDLRISERAILDGEENLYEEWDSILGGYSHYTRSSFTRPTDLLPALSGLAALFNKQLQDDYLAGHWGKDLFLSLGWYCPTQRSKSDLLHELQSPSPYLVPSWSRLCRGYTESMRNRPSFYPFHPQVQELDAQIKRAGENPFGSIKSAQLTIRSNVLDMKALKSMEQTLEYQGKANPGFWSLHADHQCLGMFHLDFRCEPGDILNEMQVYRWILLGSCEPGERSEVATSGEGEDLNGGAYGLIICSAPDSDRFHRIGVFMPVWGRKNLGLFQRLSKAETITII